MEETANTPELITRIRFDGQVITEYEQYKNLLTREFVNTAAGFVRIGYLLRVAADSNILYKSGYRSMEEFARAEYGLDASETSRFININKKYSVGGYSEKLYEQYEGYGASKLSEMLNLPDNVAAELTPQHTRNQIREIKKEVEEEQKITEIERTLEKAEAEPVPEVLDTTLKCFLYNYLKENLEKYVAVHRAVTLGDSLAKKLCDVLAPSGVNTIFTRIPSKGKLMLTIRGVNEQISILDVKEESGPEKYLWDEAADYLKLTYKSDITPEENWEMIYSEDFPRENKLVKTMEKPVSYSSEQTPATPKKEPANGVNTLQKKEKPAAVHEKETEKPPQKVEETQYPTHGNGNPPEEKTQAEPATKETQKNQETAEKITGTVVEKDPYAVRAQVCAKGLCEVIAESRWKQAVMINRELSEYLNVLVKQAESEDVSGQMSMEEYGGTEDETEDQE